MMSRYELLTFYDAAAAGDCAAVHAYITENLDIIDEYDELGRTALMYASMHGQLEVVDYLIRKGATVNLREEYPINDYPGPCALWHALHAGYTPVVLSLARAGADLISRRDARARKPIHFAAQWGFAAIVDILLHYRPLSLDETDLLGNTPLRYAAAHGHDEVVLLLIKKHANLTFASSNGLTPLDWATQRGYASTANILIQHLLTNERRGSWFDYIKTQEQADAFERLAPEQAAFLFAEKNLLDLPSQAQVEDAFAVQWAYKFKGRNPSHLEHLNELTGELAFFHAVEDLDVSQRKFIHDETHLMVAVDACVPTESIDREFPAAYVDKLKAQIQFMQQASLPGQYSLFQIKNARDRSVMYRLIKPYTHGKTYDKYCMHISSKRQLGYMIYLLATALLQVHQKCILHGNINASDVWVYETPEGAVAIAFLQFNHAYYLYQPLAVCSEAPSFFYWPPERRQRGWPIAPEENQDIYSLGYLFDALLKKWERCHLESISPRTYFISIDRFIQQSLAVNPSDRPCLDVFIDVLELELELANENLGVDTLHVDAALEHRAHVLSENATVEEFFAHLEISQAPVPPVTRPIIDLELPPFKVQLFNHAWPITLFSQRGTELKQQQLLLSGRNDARAQDLDSEDLSQDYACK